MNLHLTVTQTLELINVFLATYLLIDSSEKLYSFKEYQAGGILNWDLLEKNEFINSRPAYFKFFCQMIFPFRSWMVLLAVRILCGMGLVIFTSSATAQTSFYAILFAIGALMNLRNIAYGAETDNRFSLIIIGALLLRSLVPTQTVTLVSLWFIALQACLSYITAGVSKLFNADWRTGSGFRLVAISHDLVPLKSVNLFFEKRTKISTLINWLIILFECVFPLALVVSREAFWWFLISGLLFHLAVAIWLRLGKFLWVWVATYPALIFITQR